MKGKRNSDSCETNEIQTTTGTWTDDDKIMARNPFRGKYWVKRNRKAIYKAKSQQRLRSSILTAKTERCLIAAKYQSSPTSNYQEHVMRRTLNNYWICEDGEKTINRIVSGYPVLANKEYFPRHYKGETYMCI